MKYTLETTINLPRKKVIELFDNPENLKHWQEGFISFETISGIQSEVGAKSLVKYKRGKGKIYEMTETILVKNLPDEFSGTFEGKGMRSSIKNKFIELNADTTKWVLNNETKLSGIMKIFGFLMPGNFKKYSADMMKRFKVFAEKNN